MASKKRKKKSSRGKTNSEAKYEFLLQKGKEFSKSLRQKATPWEKKVYIWLKNLHYLFKFQEPIITKNNHLYIPDFLLDESKLLIELDGKQHYTPENKKKDARRTRNLKKEGYHVMRLTNSLISTLDEKQFEQIVSDRLKLLKELSCISK